MQDVWEDVRALLPAWVVWFWLAPALAAGPWAWLTTRLLTGWVLRRHQQHDTRAHWSARALAAYPARLAARVSALGFCLTAVLYPLLLLGPLARPTPGAVACIGLGSAALGSLGAAYALERALRPELTLRELLRGVVCAPLVRSPHLVIAALAASLLPAQLSAAYAAALGVTLLLLLTAAASGAGLHLARALGLAQLGSARLEAAARAACATRPPPAVYSLPLSHANAFAFPLLGCIAFTPALERLLDDAELSEVAAHELEHLSEPRWFRVLRAGVGVWMLAPVCAIRALYAALGHWAIVLCLVNAAAVALGFSVLSRRMEARADHGPRDGRTYARALERVYAANLVPAVLPGRGASHPHLYDRLLAVGVTPDYPRPAAPRVRGVLFALFGSLYLYMLAPYLPAMQQDDPPSEQQLYLRLAVHGGEAWSLGELGRRRWQSQPLSAASTFYRGALQLAPDELRYVSGLLWTLARQERCAELERALAERLASTQDAPRRRLLQRLGATIPCGPPRHDALLGAAVH